MSSGPPSISAVRYFARLPSADDPLAGQAFCEIGRKREAQIRPPRLDRDDAGAFHDRLQAAP